MGYNRAGFDEIVGVDIKPQPRYPFAFVQGDPLEYIAAHGREFDAIHASPPCQAYSALRSVTDDRLYPHLIEKTRRACLSAGRLYVIENVPRAPLVHAITICGLALGLRVKRHRLFESNVLLFGLDCPCHDGEWYHVSGHGSRARQRTNARSPRREARGVAHAREVMTLDKMTMQELSQAIPPAYTEFIGRQLLAALRRA